MIYYSGNDAQFCAEVMNINIILARAHNDPLSIFLATPLLDVMRVFRGVKKNGSLIMLPYTVPTGNALASPRRLVSFVAGIKT